MKRLVVLLMLCAPIVSADDRPAPQDAPRYTFSWSMGEGMLKPRGGTTRGAPVEIDTAASPAWQALQEQHIDSFERDRRAILAMSGTYRVAFDFLEVASYVAKEKRLAPYQSWGTEKIYVDTDTGKFISLVHILEMRMLDENGKTSEPMITKHWRQDWRYEPNAIVEYRGRDRWERRKLASREVKGAWSQTVHQVDESPRYASIGRWDHNASFSTWLSGETYRPLPRREWSVRDDYQALIGTNRHTVYPTGWTQEENNLKAVLTAERALDAAHPYLAREYGMARYERIRATDFAGADEYFTKTQAFWDRVHGRWEDVFAKQGHAQLRGPVDKLGLFTPLFAEAEAIVGGSAAQTDSERVIDAALHDMGAL